MKTNLFTSHPQEVGETYWQHQRRALVFSFEMFLTAWAALIHAIFPFLCVTTGSEKIKKLHHAMVTHRRSVPSEKGDAKFAAVKP